MSISGLNTPALPALKLPKGVLDPPDSGASLGLSSLGLGNSSSLLPNLNPPLSQTSSSSGLGNLSTLILLLSAAEKAKGSKSGDGSSSTTSTTPLKIAEIDQFTADSTGTSHGDKVAGILQSGNPNVSVEKFDVSGGNTSANVANSLESIIQKVKNGEQFDAVNISQQDFTNSADTQKVQKDINDLQALGVPVAVAAGNGGSQQTNQLANNNAFVVESATDGKVNSDSGQGNVVGDGSSTSFATADVTKKIANLKAQGLSVSDIKQKLTQGA